MRQDVHTRQATVGIIANPASGKDIRRLIAHATTVDNQGKVSIVRRALAGLSVMGIRQVYAMPDAQGLCLRAQDGLSYLRGAAPAVQMLDMPVTGKSDDSELAARLLQEAGVGCIITLGGDGTVRVVSKGAGEVPLLPISTGTNNVLPGFVEGTIAGLAAGALAGGRVAVEAVSVRHKWFELHVNGAAVDRALVDVAALTGRFLGTRAIWSVEHLLQIAVTRASPASIGISAIAGVAHPLSTTDPYGVSLAISPNAPRRVLAAIGPGLISEVGISSLDVFPIGHSTELVSERPLIVALDGEREIVLHEHDTAYLKLRGDGPWVVDANRVMRALADGGDLERTAQGPV